MRYDYTPVIHALSVQGELKTDGARLLIDCEEALHKLGYICKLQLQITREKPEDVQGQIAEQKAVERQWQENIVAATSAGHPNG